MNVSDDTLEKMARAYDREEASHCGEPSPWDDLDLSDPRDLMWRNERIAAMREAARVLFGDIEGINQCDGCRRGLPLDDDGIHWGEGYDMIACTADRYTGERNGSE